MNETPPRRPFTPTKQDSASAETSPQQAFPNDALTGADNWEVCKWRKW